MSSELQLQTELEEMRTRIATLEAKTARRGQVRRRLLLLASLGVISAGSVAYAQSECATGLVCFQPNTPARASEVNQNFAQLKQWLVDKVGPAETKDVTMTSASMGSASITDASLGNASVSGTLGATTVNASGMGVSGTLSAGAVSVGGNLAVGANSWGSQGTMACNVNSGVVMCPNGQFVCGRTRNVGCDVWSDSPVCCSL